MSTLLTVVYNDKTYVKVTDLSENKKSATLLIQNNYTYFEVKGNLVLQGYYTDSSDLSTCTEFTNDFTLVCDKEIRIKKSTRSAANSKLQIENAIFRITSKIEIEDDCELECSTLEIV